jgi:hypothetical protein
MDFDIVLNLNRSRLEEYLDALSIEYTSECEISELQALLLSFVSSKQRFQTIFEICQCFTESFELVESLLESNDQRVTVSLLDQFQSLKENPISYVSIHLNSEGEVIPFDKVSTTSKLIIVDSESDEVLSDAVHIYLDGSTYHRAIPFGLKFGLHDLSTTGYPYEIHTTNPVFTHSIIYTTSPLYSYCMYLDSVLDRLIWGWNGVWTEALEHSLLTLLIAVDDDLVSVITRMSSMYAAMGERSTDLDTMLSTLRESLRLSLTKRSPYAMGQLHQTLLQFLEMAESGMSSMMAIPQSFVDAIQMFLTCKIASSSHAELWKDITALVHIKYINLYTIHAPSSPPSSVINSLTLLHIVPLLPPPPYLTSILV